MSNSDSILYLARSYVGLCACEPWREEFRTFLGPTADGFVWDLARMFILHKQGVSTCSSVVRALMRFTLQVPIHFYPVTGKDSFWGEHAWATKLDATIEGKALEFATGQGGDFLWTGGHMLTFEQWDDPPSLDSPFQDFYSIDGGQTCIGKVSDGHEGKNLQCIRRRHRRYWFGATPRIQAIDLPAGQVGSKDAVLGWILTDRLPPKDG